MLIIKHRLKWKLNKGIGIVLRLNQKDKIFKHIAKIMNRNYVSKHSKTLKDQHKISLECYAS